MKPIDIIVEELEEQNVENLLIYFLGNHPSHKDRFKTATELKEFVEKRMKDIATNLLSKLPKLDRDSVEEILVEYEHQLLSLKCDFDVIALRDKAISQLSSLPEQSDNEKVIEPSGEVITEGVVIDMFKEFGTTLYCLGFLEDRPDIFLGELIGEKVKVSIHKCKESNE